MFYGKITSAVPNSRELQANSIQIEGLDGKLANLHFSVPYFVFPGQIVGIKGTNPTGDMIDVHQFYDVCRE